MKNLVYPKSTRARKLMIELDPSENYEGGTPAMVRLFIDGQEVECATYNCVAQEGSNAFNGEEIDDSEYDWILDDSTQKAVEDFIESLEVK